MVVKVYQVIHLYYDPFKRNTLSNPLKDSCNWTLYLHFQPKEIH